MRHASVVASHVISLLNGSTFPDPGQHGLTTEEERVASHLLQWPGVDGSLRPPNADLRLLGGAAFERTLQEFQKAAGALEFPTCEDEPGA